MYYSESKVIICSLTQDPILIFLVNFIKGKFESITEKVVKVKEEELKAEGINGSEIKIRIKIKGRKSKKRGIKPSFF